MRMWAIDSFISPLLLTFKCKWFLSFFVFIYIKRNRTHFYGKKKKETMKAMNFVVLVSAHVLSVSLWSQKNKLAAVNWTVEFIWKSFKPMKYNAKCIGIQCADIINFIFDKYAFLVLLANIAFSCAYG